MTEETLRNVRDARQNRRTNHAFRIIYNDTNKVTMAVIRKYCDNEEDRQDLLQETYISAFQKIGDLRDDRKFQGWINEIAANKAIRHNQQKKLLVFSSMADDEENEPDFVDDIHSEYVPEAVADRKVVSQVINEFMNELPLAQRNALWAVYGQGLKIREVAEAAGVSENTIKSQLRYGRLSLEARKADFRKRGIEITVIPVIVLIRLAFMEDVVYAAARAGMASGTGLASGAASEAGQAVPGATAAAKGAAVAAAGSGVAVKVIAGIVVAGIIAGGAVFAGSSLTGRGLAFNNAIENAARGHNVASLTEEDRALLDELLGLLESEPESIAEAYIQNHEQLAGIYDKAGTIIRIADSNGSASSGKGLLIDSDHGMYLGDIDQETRNGSGTLAWIGEYKEYRFANGEWGQGLLNGSAIIGYYKENREKWSYAKGTAIDGCLDGEITLQSYYVPHSEETIMYFSPGYITFVFNTKKGAVVFDERWSFVDLKDGRKFYSIHSIEHPGSDGRPGVFHEAKDNNDKNRYQVDYNTESSVTAESLTESADETTAGNLPESTVGETGATVTNDGAASVEEQTTAVRALHDMLLNEDAMIVQDNSDMQHDYTFSVFDLNSDGIPEVLFRCRTYTAGSYVHFLYYDGHDVQKEEIIPNGDVWGIPEESRIAATDFHMGIYRSIFSFDGSSLKEIYYDELGNPPGPRTTAEDVRKMDSLAEGAMNYTEVEYSRANVDKFLNGTGTVTGSSPADEHKIEEFLKRYVDDGFFSDSA